VIRVDEVEGESGAGVCRNLAQERGQLVWLNGDSLIGESESSSVMEGREIVSCLDIAPS